jgi:hypothetical protein
MHEDVHRGNLSAEPGDEVRDLSISREIDMVQKWAWSGAMHLTGDILQRLRAATHETHPCPFRAEGKGNGTSDTAARSSDHCRLT